jgi:hypothetical protein
MHHNNFRVNVIWKSHLSALNDCVSSRTYISQKQGRQTSKMLNHSTPLRPQRRFPERVLSEFEHLLQYPHNDSEFLKFFRLYMNGAV